MKGFKLIPLSLAIAAFAFTQFGCATPENTNTPTNANMATPEATPDKTAITAEITRIENDWPRIIKERDGAAVRRIEADDVVLVYPDGSLGNKEQDIKDIEAGNLSYESWEIYELTVNVLDRDAAIASFRFAVKNGKYKSSDGKSQDISGQYRAVDTFARRDGLWQVVGSATTPVRAPVTAASPSPKASPAASGSPAMKASPAAKASPTRRTPPPPPKPATTP
jgi:ketosteroid isomerase-like protein